MTVRGVLDGARRVVLRARTAARDLLAPAFTEQGTLTHDGHLPELTAREHLDALGAGHRRLRSSSVCTDDVRIRR